MATFSTSHAVHGGQQYQTNPLSNVYAPPDFTPQNDTMSPLENLDLLKNLSAEKKQTKDGQPPKRRGPKPDSKPALTRRQELNRQAQRTHRERKEMYIKALEQHAMAMRETFARTEKERDELAKENRMLKELLLKNGITYDLAGNKITFQRDPSPHNIASSSGSISGSYQNPTESTGLSPQSHHLGSVSFSDATSPQRQRNMAQLPNPNLDYDAIGMDFVLTTHIHTHPSPAFCHLHHPTPLFQTQARKTLQRTHAVPHGALAQPGPPAVPPPDGERRRRGARAHVRARAHDHRRALFARHAAARRALPRPPAARRRLPPPCGPQEAARDQRQPALCPRGRDRPDPGPLAHLGLRPHRRTHPGRFRAHQVESGGQGPVLRLRCRARGIRGPRCARRRLGGKECDARRN